MISDLAVSNSFFKELELGIDLRGRSYRGRYAPSPTGPLHIGNLRTALMSWLRARTAQGEWLLRIDDLDTHRNSPGAVESIKADLLWLGLSWDEDVIFQSERKRIYYSALSFFRAQSKLYPCKCSRKLLAKNSNSDLSLTPYPGTCRDLSLPWDSQDEKQLSWRLKVGPKFSLTSGDVIVRRADGFIAYNLATAVDDLILGIGEVIRGSDLQVALPFQLAVIEALEASPPIYKHVPLVINEEGKKLAKRERSKGLAALKLQGFSPEKVIGMMAASIGLISEASELSAFELLQDIRRKKYKLDLICQDYIF